RRAPEAARRNVNEPPPRAAPPRAAPPLRSPFASAFNLSVDSDQIILAAILFLLYRDKADPWLMIALVYIFFA
ncbi:MAG: hypothetical protein P4M02_07370, partial [Clostridia bacterium]|nr:hypothetical protein [Clostridia bacterium]